MASKIDVNHGKELDWGRTSKDYAKYRDIYPEEFYLKIVEKGLCIAGQNALDLGTGTGVLPRNMYKYGARWTGADISENQIAEAKRLSAENGMDISYITAPAESTGLPEAYFDVVTACQCFLYFDKEKAFDEIYRILKPGGRFLIFWIAWLPYENEITMTSEELVLKYNPSYNGAGYRRKETVAPNFNGELFECVSAYSYDMDITFTRESWHGRIITCRGIGASTLSESEIECFKKEHLEYIKTLPETFKIPHLVDVYDFRKKD